MACWCKPPTAVWLMVGVWCNWVEVRGSFCCDVLDRSVPTSLSRRSPVQGRAVSPAARSREAAVRARSGLKAMRKKWGKEGYSVVGTISTAFLVVAFVLFLVMTQRFLRHMESTPTGCANGEDAVYWWAPVLA